jgi:hypothetical protein
MSGRRNWRPVGLYCYCLTYIYICRFQAKHCTVHLDTPRDWCIVILETSNACWVWQLFCPVFKCQAFSQSRDNYIIFKGYSFHIYATPLPANSVHSVNNWQKTWYWKDFLCCVDIRKQSIPLLGIWIIWLSLCWIYLVMIYLMVLTMFMT